jgi:membrane protease YdiL (CAAX protease family)
MHEPAHERQVPIWFFIGVLFTVYGIIILASAIFGVLHPPPPDQRVQLWDLHVDVWWSILMILFGIVYTVRFWPRPGESLTGRG